MKLSLSFFLIFLSSLIFSQNTITGKIVNQSNKAVVMVEVLLLNRDSIVIKSQLTDTDGKFIIEITKGDYLFKVRQMGSFLHSQKIKITQNLNLGVIKIIENEQQLEEVIITSKKKHIERKVDRLVFNVENSISATGGDAIDALKVTPGINVQNDKISMIGKSSLSVMVNERLMQLSWDDLINFLKTIKSDDIKSIEVITNPPAKYDAEGNSGVVNIKLKKAKPNSWNSSFRSSYRQATYPTGSLGNSVNYQKNKITLSTNINYSKGSNYTLETQKIKYFNENWDSNDNFKNYTKLIAGKFAIDYKINDKISMGLQYLGGNNKPNVKQSNTAILSDINTNNIYQNIQTNLSNKKSNLNHSLNFHTLYEIDTIGKKLSLDVDYFNYKRMNNQAYSTNDNNEVDRINTFTSINNTGNQNIKNCALKIDMEHPLKWVNLDYGSKLSFTKTNSNIDYFNLSFGNPIFDANKSNQFEYKENNQALYFSASKKFGKDKWETQFGLRLESTRTEGYSLTLNQTSITKYSKLFPTSYITYTPNENNIFSLNYGKRINRPKYGSLNPFKEYSNPYSYIVGNPFLEPSTTNNISFGHILKNNLNTSLFYSYESNGYSLITFIEQNSINQISTFLNYYKSENFGLSESYTYAKFKGWENYISGNIYYNKTTSNNPSVQKITKGLGGDISSYNSFVFNKSKTFLGSLDVTYSFPNTSVNTISESVFNTDFGIKYLALKKQLTITFTISDAFKTNKQKWSEKINGISIYSTNYEDAQKINLSISYKFGNNKLKPKDSKGGNNEEAGRASGD